MAVSLLASWGRIDPTPRVAAFRDAKPVKQQLPGGDSRQRQRGGGGVIEGARFVGHQALIHQLIFTVAAGPAQGAGVPDLIAWCEQRHFLTDGLHHANGVPAQHPRRVALEAGAHFGVHRIDRDRLHGNQQITPVGGRDRQVDLG